MTEMVTPPFLLLLCNNSRFIEQFQIIVCTSLYLPQGEGGRRQRGQMRNAGDNLAITAPLRLFANFRCTPFLSHHCAAPALPRRGYWVQQLFATARYNGNFGVIWILILPMSVVSSHLPSVVAWVHLPCRCWIRR